MGKGNNSKDQARYDSIASNLEVFVDDISTLFIFEGQKEKDIEEATKVLKKAIKHLKNGTTFVYQFNFPPPHPIDKFKI